jgi:hypothetical protein
MVIGTYIKPPHYDTFTCRMPAMIGLGSGGAENVDVQQRTGDRL